MPQIHNPMVRQDAPVEQIRTAPPVLLAVDDDPPALRALARSLVRRFGADYHICTADSAAAGLALLENLSRQGAEVALVIAKLWLPDLTGLEFLAQAHEWHPGAKRGLLTTLGDRLAVESLHRAMALGQVDLEIAQPWASPEEGLYLRVSEALSAWWRVHRPRFEQIRIVGPQWAARSHEMRDLLTRNTIAYGFYAAESDAGRRLLADVGLTADRLPAAVLDDGRVLVNPANHEIAEALGGRTRPDPGLYDVAVIGAGPAGLAAAVSAASEGLRTVVIEHEALGGQAGTSSMIRNYLGFPHGISGEELTGRAAEQARHFGAQFVYTRSAVGLRVEGRDRVVTLADGSSLVSRAVVIATGVAYRRLGIPALERLVGAGVFYGAANSEASALRGEAVFVVGGGNSAGQAALHLAEYAAKVTLVIRGDSLAAGMSAYLTDQIAAAPNVEVCLQTQVVGGCGEQRLEGLVLRDTATGKTHVVPAAALFVLIGAAPRTDWVAGTLERDGGGYLLTGRDLAPGTGSLAGWPLGRPPLPLEASVPGVFAVGDVRHGSLHRVAAAAGEGSVAVRLVHEYLSELKASAQ